MCAFPVLLLFPPLHHRFIHKLQSKVPEVLILLLAEIAQTDKMWWLKVRLAKNKYGRSLFSCIFPFFVFLPVLAGILWPETALNAQIMIIPLAHPLRFLASSLVPAVGALYTCWFFCPLSWPLLHGLLACYILSLCCPSTSIHPCLCTKDKCCLHKASLLGH